MIKLIPDPTFDALVSLTVVGLLEPIKLPMTFRHMASDKVQDWFKSNEGKKPAEALSEIIDGWNGVMGEDGKNVPYSPEALDTLLKNYPAATLEIVRAWQTELNESRVKN
jgi:hypothetical protein